jgi:NAD(P)-dependent dehydrogenase (short-subunit alcohol dehydrogenase family)
MQLSAAVRALCDAGVEFVAIGGISASLHGSARVTFDLDICFSRSPQNLRRLAEALAAFHPRPRGFPPERPFVWDERTLNNGTVFTLDTDVGPIDLLAEVAGIGAYADAKARSVTAEAFGRQFATLNLPGLIAAKRAAGRDKDLEAIKELESLLEAQEPGPD